MNNSIRSCDIVAGEKDTYRYTDGQLFNDSSHSYNEEVSVLKVFFIAKYPYHFLTVPICWSHPTQWPMQRCDFKIVSQP